MPAVMLTLHGAHAGAAGRRTTRTAISLALDPYAGFIADTARQRCRRRRPPTAESVGDEMAADGARRVRLARRPPRLAQAGRRLGATPATAYPVIADERTIAQFRACVVPARPSRPGGGEAGGDPGAPPARRTPRSSSASRCIWWPTYPGDEALFASAGFPRLVAGGAAAGRAPARRDRAELGAARSTGSSSARVRARPAAGAAAAPRAPAPRCWPTARSRYHLRSAGITYHGAAAVEVARDRLGVGLLVLVPQRAVLEIAAAELPALVGIVDARLQALALLVLADVQEELEDRGAALGEQRARSR